MRWKGEVISGGNFHGQPIAFALDFLAISVSALAGISERRIERMVNPALSEGLPAFLAMGAGLNSGFMMPQVTAAALVSENKVLGHPASVDSITTSGNKEDYVSMGMTAALKLKRVIQNVRHVLAIEALAAAQAVDLLAPLKPGKRAQQALREIRAVSPMVTPGPFAGAGYCEGRRGDPAGKAGGGAALKAAVRRWKAAFLPDSGGLRDRSMDFERRIHRRVQIAELKRVVLCAFG